VIDFASDTQAPLMIEKMFLKANHNEKATEMIFNEIHKRHPSALFITGDVVSLGYDIEKWKKMDTYLKTLRDDSIPVYAAPGNHEYLFKPTLGIKMFKARFPMYQPQGYAEIIDSVAIILLNSNFRNMGTTAVDEQDAWYKNALQQLDTTAAVKFIIVGCHHSPYTNSKVVAPSELVRDKFVAPFLKSKKCVLFVSGHSHNFEQFKVDGKPFLVIGGGGGIHQPLYTGKKQRTQDVSSDYKPMFHYLEITRMHDTLQVTSRRLKPDFSGFENGLTLKL
jgi:3',5'-cyclic AMP phosphodiesterase CpdA